MPLDDTGTPDYSDLYVKYGEQYNVSPYLLRAVAQHESGENAHSTSAQNRNGTYDRGLMQINDGTARGIGVRNPYDPDQSVAGAARLLRQHLDTFKGDQDMALAAYNAGPDPERWTDTQRQYVQDVKSRMPAPQPEPAAQPSVTLEGIRQKYPQYKDMSDQELLQGLHQKYYSDMPFDQFSEKLGYKPEPEAAQPGDVPPLSAGKQNPLAGQKAPGGHGIVPNLPLAKVDEGAVVPQQSAAEAAEHPLPNTAPAETPATAPGLGEQVAGAAGNVLGAVKQGWQEGQNAVVTEYGQKLADKYGLGGDARALNLIMQGMNAAFRGAQQSAYEIGKAIGGEQLGRDLAAAPEAFPQESMGLRGVVERPPVGGVAEPPKAAEYPGPATPEPPPAPPPSPATPAAPRPSVTPEQTALAELDSVASGKPTSGALPTLEAMAKEAAPPSVEPAPVAEAPVAPPPPAETAPVAPPAEPPQHAPPAEEEPSPSPQPATPVAQPLEVPGQPRLNETDTLYAGPGAALDPEAWKRAFGPVLGPPARAALEAANDVRQSIADGIAPIQGGTVRAQASAADFANALRRVDYRYGQIDKEIERAFKPDERAKMGASMDAQSVFEQQARDMPPEQAAAARDEFNAGGTGLSGLKPEQQRALQMLDKLSQIVWSRMQDRGLVEPNARALPYYFPRQIIQWTEAEGFKKATGQGGGNKGLDARGSNLTTAGPMGREYLTPEETEAAARAKLGQNSAILRDIRSLPARLAYSEKAIAGVDLMNSIDKVGKDAGVDLVVKGDIPGTVDPADYFTMADHPSFRQWTGTGWQAIHVSKEFEGPLKSVLTQPSARWYRAAQQLKGGVMSAIMWSPFIHLAVEYGRALPLILQHPSLTLRSLRDASTLRRDLGYMDQATRDGLSPLGQGWHVDPATIADQANVEGRTGFLNALRQYRDQVASGAGKIGGQWLHDVVQHPHQTLLWDQVFNLQVGLYDSMRKLWIEKGYSPDVAGTMAAHIANRYAGALPPEHLSKAANMAANLLLFSRSFTLGNLGVMKDMLNGAPSHIRARIEQMAGGDAAKSAQSALRRKAISAFVMDVGLFYMANGLLQTGLQTLRGAQNVGLPQAAQQTYNDWLDKATSAVHGAASNPLSIFGVLPQHWNEPGKQDRVFAGTDSTGRGVYLRLPPGKVGEEFLGWFAKPGTLLMNKASPMVRPIIESIFGQDSLGRKLFEPNPQTVGDYLRIAGAVVKHIGESLGPTSTIQGLHEMYQHYVQGQPQQGDPWISAAKVIGPATGVAQVSQGYPGGPAAGEMHAQSERQQFEIQKAMPAIREKLKAGDVDGANADMTALHMDPGLQRYYRNQTLHPGATPRQVRKFQQSATPEERERLERQQP